MIYEINEVITPSGTDGMEYSGRTRYDQAESIGDLIHNILRLDEDDVEIEVEPNGTVVVSMVGGLIDGCSEGYLTITQIDSNKVKSQFEKTNLDFSNPTVVGLIHNLLNKIN